MKAWITRDASGIREFWLQKPDLLPWGDTERYRSFPTGSIVLMPDMLPEFQPVVGKPISMTLIVCEVQE